MYFFLILFLITSFFIFHSYILYPVSLQIFTLFIKKNFRANKDYTPDISIIISAYNEDRVIENTLRRIFLSDYPPERLQILVGSDCSTDNTNDILATLSEEIGSLDYFLFNKRRGKKSVINDLIKYAKGEILIFCDANSLFNEKAIRNLVQYYVDKRVGGVCGRLILSVNNDLQTGNQEKKYWDYETKIKQLEGKLGALIGSNGAIYSIRKILFTPMPEDKPVVDDLFLSLKILEQNNYFIFATDAQAEEKLKTSLKQEFKRKVRIMPRNFETLKTTKSLLFSKRFLVSYSFWSHKIIRWFSPILLVFVIVSNIMILNFGIVYQVFLLFQVSLYVVAFIGFIMSKLNKKNTFFELPFYFILTNIAMVVGYKHFLFKQHRAYWEPTARG